MLLTISRTEQLLGTRGTMVYRYLVTLNTIYTKLMVLCSNDSLAFLIPDEHVDLWLHDVRCYNQGIVSMVLTRDRLIMTSIYIEPGHRRQGIARKIIQALKDASDETWKVVQVNCKLTPESQQSSMELKSLLVSEGFEVDPDLGEDYFLWGGSEELEL